MHQEKGGRGAQCNGLTQAARTLLTALQWIMLGDEATPDPEAMAEICLALDRFRAAGVREERERCAQRLRDEANAAEPSYIVQSTFKAAIECLEAPPHD